MKVPGSAVSKNNSTKCEVFFEAPVTVKELRMVFTKTVGNRARVKEVFLYSDTPSKSKKRILTI